MLLDAAQNRHTELLSPSCVHLLCGGSMIHEVGTTLRPFDLRLLADLRQVAATADVGDFQQHCDATFR